MEGESIVTTVLGNFTLLGATLGIYAALGNRGRKLASQQVFFIVSFNASYQGVELHECKRHDDFLLQGICRVCSGSGVQKCTLCYGRGSIAKPGYVNVANPLHRKPCLRCEGAKQIACGSCAGLSKFSLD